MISALGKDFKQVKRLSDHVIYQSKTSPDTYKMLSKSTGKEEGMLIARPEYITKKGIYPDKKNYWAYYVVGLHAKIKETGVGKIFDKFLRGLAKKDERCEGRIWLRAFNNMEPSGRASSTWWYKQGYRGCNPKAQEDLDRFMRRQKTKHGDWYKDMDMYLPEYRIK